MNEKIHILKDEKLENGFQVHGARHEEGIVAEYPGMNMQTCKAEWTLAQWGVYRHPLSGETPRLNLKNGGFVYETPSLKITAHPDDKDCDLRMELRTTEEYSGRIRNYGEDWCHILLEQSGLHFNAPSIGELEELRYTADLQIDYCDCRMDKEKFIPNKHSCQVHQYLTVQDLKDGHFMWFGIPFYDHRYTKFPGYIGIDSGKADATGQIIINLPFSDFCGGEFRLGEWLHYDVDILPLIKKAISIAWGYDRFINADLRNIKVTGTNIGWEMFYEFNGALQIKNMRLVGIKKE